MERKRRLEFEDARKWGLGASASLGAPSSILRKNLR